jgi:hypothetical protein
MINRGSDRFPVKQTVAVPIYYNKSDKCLKVVYNGYSIDRYNKRRNIMSKKIRLIKKRRVCRHRGCEQVLSIYNPDSYCYAHQQLSMAQSLPPQPLLKH